MGFWEGSEWIRGNNLFRQIMMAHYMPRKDGEAVLSPIAASVGEMDWSDRDGTNDARAIQTAAVFAERGIEVLWQDEYWFPVGFPEGVGTWEPDPAKYPRGLKPVGDGARAAGVDYLLWFEPERVHPGSRIDQEHPEWVMKPQGEFSQLFKLHDPKARQWLTDYIDVQISAAQITWLRWDFNIEPLGFWRRNDAPNRQGITEIRHIEGLYAMWDDLCARHPGLVVDNVSSGGRRIDLESSMRGVSLWHSDLQCFPPYSPAADQLQNAGLHLWVPIHGCGTVGYEPSYEFRSAMTTGNVLCKMDEQGRYTPAAPGFADDVERTVAIYGKLRPYMIGDFYLLFPHSGRYHAPHRALVDEKVWFGYQCHRPDMEAGFAMVFRREMCPETETEILLHGIEPEAAYEITFEDTDERMVKAGRDLSSLKVEIPLAPGSAIVYYRKSG